MADGGLGDSVTFHPVPRPSRAPLVGAYACLEPPSAAGHAEALFAAATVPGGDAIWDYLPYGPFEDIAAMGARVEACAASADPHYVTIRNLDDAGGPEGMASLMRIVPEMGVIEIGHIWMAPALQRTRAATEAIFLLMDHALGTLGYRRLEWKCNALNAASRRAAERFGFTYEGTFRQHMVVKGRNRDSAWFSILDREWPQQRRRFAAWLAPENFDSKGRQRRRLEEI